MNRSITSKVRLYGLAVWITLCGTSAWAQSTPSSSSTGDPSRSSSYQGEYVTVDSSLTRTGQGVSRATQSTGPKHNTVSTTGTITPNGSGWDRTTLRLGPYGYSSLGSASVILQQGYATSNRSLQTSNHRGYNQSAQLYYGGGQYHRQSYGSLQRGGAYQRSSSGTVSSSGRTRSVNSSASGRARRAR
jgi:hypothetical protein